MKGPKGAPNGGAVSMIGSGEAGERLIVKCSHKICTEPTKVVYFKNDGSKTESKSLSVNQDFTLDLIPNYAVDFGSGKEDTIVRLMSRNSVLVYAKQTTSPFKEPMLFFQSDLSGAMDADRVDYWISEVQEFLDLYLENLKWAAMKRSNVFSNGEEVTKCFAPATNALQHRLKLALEKAKRANLPPKELGLLESLINSICDTFNEMAAWDIEMAKIYSEKSYVSSSKYNSQLETIAKQMEEGLPKRKFSSEMEGAFKSGTQAGAKLLVKSLAGYVQNDEGRHPDEKRRTLEVLNNPETVKVLSADLFSALEASKALQGLDNRVMAINRWVVDTSESISARLTGKKAEAKIASVIEKGGPSAFDHKFSTCAGSGVELRDKGKLAPGEENVVNALKESYSRGLAKNQLTFNTKPNVKGLLDKIQLHSDVSYLTNYTSTKFHFNVDVNNILNAPKASMDINTGIHHKGISEDGSLGWTAGANARLHVDSILAQSKLTHMHLNAYMTVKKKLKGDRTISSGFFVSRDVSMPTGKFQDAMNNGGVLDKFHHELSYTNSKKKLKFSMENTYYNRHNRGQSLYSGMKISKGDAFGVKNLEMYASAGYEAHKTGSASWQSGGGKAQVGLTWKFRL